MQRQQRPDTPGNIIDDHGTKGQVLRTLATVAVVILAIVASIAGSVAAAGAALRDFALFPPETRVDGLDLGGLPYEQGYALVADKRKKELDSVLLRLHCAGNTVTFDAKALGLSYNIDEVMEGAYYVRQRDETPLELIESVLEPKLGVSGETTLEYDAAAVERAVREAVRAYDIEPVDAKVAFSKDGAAFAFVEDSPGRKANADKAAAEALAWLAGGTARQAARDIDVGYGALKASITVGELRKNTVLVAEYRTDVNDNENRNVNIGLMCNAVDGLAVAPGETLSINALVGRRTEEKGFKSAPAIVDGNITDDVGGGICQLSGTLYNAALLADMEIIERVRHTFPSEYLPIGLDSTLNWDNKDLKIRNTTAYPVYISAKLDALTKQVIVRLYGKPLEPGVTIEVLPHVVREIEPEGQKVLISKTLAPGQRKVIRKARKGYEVKVYRNRYLNGNLIRSELISHDRYNPRDAVVWVGADDEAK